ncbi:MAG: hypothetical protein WA021_03580 [Minisyncoccia bacterium]
MRWLPVVLFLLAPAIALAAPRTFKELTQMSLDLINGGIGIALILAIVIYFYGVATAIPHLKTDDSERLRAHFVWGILALFVMFSVWGILALLRNTLFSGSGYNELGAKGKVENCATFDDCVVGK